MARRAWLDGYERHPVNAGHAPLPGLAKIILHRTQTPFGTLDRLIRSWESNPGTGLPHLGVDRKRCVQLLPLNTCAYTSKNGGIDANKVGTPIQFEICGYSEDGDFDPETFETVARAIADLIRAGVELDLDAVPEFHGPIPMLASPGHWARDITEGGRYRDLNTIIGHQHLAGNDHWDPGAIDITRLVARVRQHLGGNATTQEDWLMADSPQFVRILTELGNVRQHTSNVVNALQDRLAGFETHTRAITVDAVTTATVEIIAAINAAGPGGDLDAEAIAGRVATIIAERANRH